MKPVEKAIKLKNSPSRLEELDYNRFYNELRVPMLMLHTIEGNCKKGGILHNEELLLEARRNYVVALTTSFEIFWREFIREIVDKGEVKNITKLKKYKFSFNDLMHILGNKLTLGELVSSSYTFQSIDVIQEVAKNIFQIDFFDIFSNSKFEVIEGEGESAKSKTFTGEEILAKRQLIDNCFENRHAIVHDSRKNIILEIEKIKETEKIMWKFSVWGAFCLREHLQI